MRTAMQKQVDSVRQCERVFKMLENDMYMTEISHAVLKLLRSGQEITKGESPYFRNF